LIEIGPDLFLAACGMGLEDLVSKYRDRPYRGGRCKHWIKVKNREHPAMAPVPPVKALAQGEEPQASRDA
jgi:ATP-dependent DNA ligase